MLAVTSLNSTEAFGMVQVEAMLSGTPVVASDLPGVREAVGRTGMGEIVPPRDPARLAAALIDVLREPARYVRPRADVVAAFDLERSLRRIRGSVRGGAAAMTDGNTPRRPPTAQRQAGAKAVAKSPYTESYYAQHGAGGRSHRALVLRPAGAPPAAEGRPRCSTSAAAPATCCAA